MDEAITPSVKRRRLRGMQPWSIAVVALSAAAVLISYKGIDAWRDRWIKPREVPTVSLAGVGVVHAAPDTIDLEISIFVTALRQDETTRLLRKKSALVLDRLHEALDPNDVIRTDGLAVKTDIPGPADLFAYHGFQTILVRSTSVSRGLATYHMLEQLADPDVHLIVPRCTLQDKRTAARQATQEAWHDLQGQLDDVRGRTSLAIGPAVSFATASPPIEPVDETWPCDAGFAVQTTVAVTYSVR